MSRIAHRPLRRIAARLLPCLLLAASLVACGRDAAAPALPSIAGRWSGSAAFGTVQFEASFTQDGQAVAGTGDFSSPLGSGPFTIAGTVIGQDVNLTLVSAEFGTSSYIGRFTGANTIEGRLQNPDFELKLQRDR